MARKTNRSSQPRRSRGGKSGKSSAPLYIILAIVALAALGAGVWYFFLRDTGTYVFKRSDLDKYVEATQQSNLLGDGASVYVDMSDGMNYAYASASSKEMLEAMINKLAANSAIEFNGLADGKITPMNMSHTELFNYMLNPANFNLQQAPIEKTLAQIVEKRQPAILMTDFEEYKGGVIEQAAYAKQYFTEWLAAGYNITFYKWDFTEGGKQKHMFMAVFDDNAQRLGSLVANAVQTTAPGMESYVLGSRDFAYPTFAQYLSLKQGGNYHNENGQDVVTAVMENGGPNDYISYCKPYASATGAPGQFAPLDCTVGAFAEYYPLGVKWADAMSNANMMQQPGVKPADQFKHLFSKLFVDFNAQSGYTVDAVEVRVFDMQGVMQAVGETLEADAKLKVDQLDKIDMPEINMFLTAGFAPAKQLPGWSEVFVDFDKQFNGSFVGGIPTTDLVRANVVVSKATPNLARAKDFFGWDGNQSLANSVRETLTASTSNPQGHILFTYYFKTLGE